MKILISVLGILALSSFGESLNKTCAWTGCEGIMRPGQSICDEYKKGMYEDSYKSDCSWTSSKVKCCNYEPAPGCQLTEHCADKYAWILTGAIYDGPKLCEIHFNKKFSGQEIHCSGYSYRYECC